MNTLGEKIQDGSNIWNTNDSSRCNIDDDDYWDEDGSTSDKLEVQHLEFDDILINFDSGTGAVCFSKDGTWYSGADKFTSTDKDGETSVDDVFFICSPENSLARCDVSVTDGTPDIDHENLFSVQWSRFGNVTLEKWSKRQDELGFTVN